MTDVDRIAALEKQNAAIDLGLLINHAVANPDAIRVRQRNLMDALQRDPRTPVAQSREARHAERRALHEAARELFASFGPRRPTPDA